MNPFKKTCSKTFSSNLEQANFYSNQIERYIMEAISKTEPILADRGSKSRLRNLKKITLQILRQTDGQE